MATRKPLAGRASIFRGKENGVRLQGVITKDGAKHFERARSELAALYAAVVGRGVSVSDADTIEYLARGAEATRKYLERST